MEAGSRFVYNKGASYFSQNSQVGFREERSAAVSGDTVISEPEDLYVPTPYVDAAIQQIKQRIGKFQKANGLCVPISCENGFNIGDPVPGIHRSGREFKQLFKMFGYATHHLCNPRKTDIMALYCALATKINYPPSYRRLVFFFTGHGFSNHISTEDGYISIYDIIANFSGQHAPDIRNIPKFFIFDCCRTEHPEGLSVSSRDSADQVLDRNIHILYTTLPRTKSYAIDGVSIPTAKLVEILRDKDHNFLDLNRMLYQRIREEVDDPDLLDHMNPVSQSAVYERISFHHEREQAMKPTDLQLTSSNVKVTSITWTAPRHADHQKLQKYDICISKGNERIRKSTVKRSEKSIQMWTREVENCSICVQAAYKDGTVVTSDPIRVPYRCTIRCCCYRCKENHSSLCLASMILLAFLSLLLLAVTSGFVGISAPQSRQLIVANEIITHPMLQPSWINTVWYSGVTIQQIIYRPSDNLDGIPITVIDSRETHIVTRENLLTHIYPLDQKISIPNVLVKFPLNYISMPLYYLRNSVIFFELSITLPSQADTLREAYVYIFDSYENIPTLPDSSVFSRAITSFNITDAANKLCQFNYTVEEDSYLFFVLRVNTSANYYWFFSNLTFDLKTFEFTKNINTSADTFYLGDVKSVNFGIFSPPNGIYLYAHPVDDEKRLLVHLDLQWEKRKYCQYSFIAVFAVALMLFCILSIFFIAQKCRRKFCRTRSNRYRALSDISQTVSIYDEIKHF